MIEDKLKLLSGPLMFQDKLDILIESFVEFYGEEKRSIIENKFKSVLILKFCNTENLENIISDIKTDLFKEVFSVPKDRYLYFNLDKFLESLDTKNGFEFVYFSSDIKEIVFNGEEDNNVIYEKYKNGEYPLIDELRRRYAEIKGILEPYEKTMNEESEREKQIDRKYFNMLVSEYSHLLNPRDIERYNSWGLATDSVDLYLGSSLKYSSFAFGSKSEEFLNNPDTPSWRIDSIHEDRVKFLKDVGFDFGEEFALNDPTYEDCLNNPECYAFMQRMLVLFSEIEARKKELNDMRVKEIVYGLRDYKDCQEIIDRKGFVNKNDALGPFVYQSPVSCCELNFIRDGDRLVESGLILINAGMGNIDQTVIHELNHQFETSIIELSDKGSISITGWDLERNTFYDRKIEVANIYEGITRPYELMSEYINDRIADDIKDIMYAKGEYIVSRDNGKSNSSYRFVDFLLEEFYCSFKSIIVESRNGGNIQHIYDMLGKDNFEELNAIVNRYYEIFGFTFTGRSAMVDWYHGIETEDSKKIGELASAKDLVLAKMHEHLNEVKMGL